MKRTRIKYKVNAGELGQFLKQKHENTKKKWGELVRHTLIERGLEVTNENFKKVSAELNKAQKFRVLERKLGMV